MGKIIILKPQLDPETLERDKDLGKKIDLNEMYRLIGCGTVGHVALGHLPSGLGVSLWCDEDGLYKPALLPNREVRGHQLVGTLLVCGLDPASGDSVDFNEIEHALVMAQARGWRKLAANAPKPEPGFRLIEDDV